MRNSVTVGQLLRECLAELALPCAEAVVIYVGQHAQAAYSEITVPYRRAVVRNADDVTGFELSHRAPLSVFRPG